ncbi:hypothetical protein SAMN06265360_105159 [Haloechinothrix alba]|uniref:Uncharacterized protein n=1 Tax=Haloechinothrix alba TaxID=664784 RepID=A0A238W678_9PSEU|nr:hypothetical protein SAMN06265360_105159 [Haloechinothrix alba]
MPRVQVHGLDSAPESSRDSLKELHQKFGGVLNIFGEMANSPAVLSAFTAAEGTIADYTRRHRPHHHDELLQPLRRYRVRLARSS